MSRKPAPEASPPSSPASATSSPAHSGTRATPTSPPAATTAVTTSVSSPSTDTPETGQRQQPSLKANSPGPWVGERDDLARRWSRLAWGGRTIQRAIPRVRRSLACGSCCPAHWRWHKVAIRQVVRWPPSDPGRILQRRIWQ
jgi:hypothetical protein